MPAHFFSWRQVGIDSARVWISNRVSLLQNCNQLRAGFIGCNFFAMVCVWLDLAGLKVAFLSNLS